MTTKDRILRKIVASVAEFGDLDPASVNEATPLIGENAVVKSRALVETLLEMEDFTEDEFKTVFDWTSDAALSASQSVFRDVGTLADHLNDLVTKG